MRTTTRVHHRLLVSGPNGGGLALLLRDQAIVLDRRDATGLAVCGGRLLACLQDDGARTLLRVEDGQVERLALDDAPLDLHDVLLRPDGRCWAVATERNAVLAIEDGRATTLHRFDGEPDSCHVNALAEVDGRLLAARFGRFTAHRGFKGRTAGAGEVLDLADGRVLVDGLSQPHSLVPHDGLLWLCNSELGEVRAYRGGQLVERIALPGYTRGLAVTDTLLYVGLSRSRNPDALHPGGRFESAVVAVVERASRTVLGYVALPWPEIYDIRIVEDAGLAEDLLCLHWPDAAAVPGATLAAPASDALLEAVQRAQGAVIEALSSDIRRMQDTTAAALARAAAAEAREGVLAAQLAQAQQAAPLQAFSRALQPVMQRLDDARAEDDAHWRRHAESIDAAGAAAAAGVARIEHRLDAAATSADAGLQQLGARLEAALEATLARALQSPVQRELEQTRADLAQALRWLDDALRLSAASFGSARWRIGDGVCRIAERVLGRGRPRLARDGIEQIERNARAWTQARLLRAAAGAPEGDAAAQPAALPLPPARDGGFDIVCFPVIDWHFRVQRPQHLARVLGARGHRVFYLTLEPVAGCDAPGFDIVEQPADGVWIVRLRVTVRRPPNVYRERLDGAALDAYLAALDVFRAAVGLSTMTALVDLPFWRPLVAAVPGATMVYDCMDHHAGFGSNAEAMLGEEARLLREADAVVVTSSWLRDSIGATRPVSLIRNGADIERFATPVEPPLPRAGRPVVGYIGAIAEWFDTALVAAVAQAMPDVDFVLVGDVTHPDVSALSALPNVRMTGEVPYSDAPAWVQSFDVCTIPFLINALTLATNPVKAYEYLAAGKPVVATPMPEVMEMDGMVAVVDGAAAFIEALRRALDDCADAQACARRRAWAQAHDWTARGEALEGVIRGLYPSVSVVVLAWNNLEYTRACLESLDRHTGYPDWELVLVDNASSDGTPDHFREIAARRPRTTLVLNDENLGFAAGNNTGLAVARGEVVVILNNDTFVTPGWLSGLVGHLRRNPSLGIVGPVTNNIGNEARIEVEYGDMTQMLAAVRPWTAAHPRALFDCPVVAFFCCAIPRDVLEAVGPLDEDFGQGFFEDDDYCNRIRAIGRGVAIADDVFVHHHLSASFSTLKAERRQALFERNKAIYERKWGRWTPHRYRAR